MKPISLFATATFVGATSLLAVPSLATPVDLPDFAPRAVTAVSLQIAAPPTADALGVGAVRTNAAQFLGGEYGGFARGLGSADLASGTLRAAVEVTDTCVTMCGTSAIVQTQLADFLTFDADATVQWSFGIDGLMETPQFVGRSWVQTSVTLYDMTGATQAFGANGLVAPNGAPVQGGGGVHYDRTRNIFGGLTQAGADASNLELIRFVNVDIPAGSLVDLAISGAYEVRAGVGYMIVLEQILFAQARGDAGAPQRAAADFLGTSTFRFDDLGGASFESASGVFLTESPTAVPLPGAAGLLAAGLGGLALVRRRRR